MKKNNGGNGVVVMMMMVMLLCSGVGGEENLKEECSNDFEKMVNCVDFVRGAAAVPSKECCDSIEVIKESKPQCLCFFIQQTHNGNQQIKNLGIQESKLLQLPSVCHLKNSSVSYCPKLLGLPANSPDAAIFSNITSSATPATPTAASPVRGSGTKTVANAPAGVTAVAIAVIFFMALPAIPSYL